ncbi:MAG: heavy metal translocating P-type ATPase [Sedimentitalea sp.]
MTHAPSPAVCPGCVAMPAPRLEAAPLEAKLALSLPGIHCGGCISTVERGLSAHPGVRQARVNLTLKRAMIEAESDVTARELIAALAKLGYEAHELDPAALGTPQSDAAGRALLVRLAVAGFAAMNVMLLSVSVWSGATDATRDMFHWISAAITFPTIAFAAQPFFANAWSALSVRRLNMDVPISLAILLALATSLWETMLSGHHAYFDAALTLTFFLLAGRYLDHRTRAVARSAAQELAALEVPRAWRIEAGGEVETPVSALRVGDLVRVRPGGRLPVDGVISSGCSELDRSLLSGETLPVFAEPGLAVSAGEINLTGPLVVKATAVGADTSLHQLSTLVAVAESGRSRYTSLADTAAKLYAPGVHILAGLAFVGWYLWSGDLRVALNIAAAVLIITCPCALGLAVPAVTTAASGRLFRDGLLIKNATALERLAQVDTVVFDKTGTLTTGTPEVTNLGDHTPEDMSLMLALAQGSDHPLSQALTKAARATGVRAAQLTDVQERPGYGTHARYKDREIKLGRASWLNAPETHNTAVWFSAGDGRAPRPFTFRDTLRPGAVETVRTLKNADLDVVLLSGDTNTAVSDMAQALGIITWNSNALPAQKVAYVQNLADQGRKVLMIGDGLNDTGALAAAHVSISPATALDAARTASDIVLLGAPLTPIPNAIAVSGQVTKRIRENFRIATLYNLIAVPLAIAGLATPLIAALAMSSSSITVSLNALRLRGSK